MNSKHHRLIGILILFLGLIASHSALAQDPNYYEVTSADPAFAVQGTLGLDVTISGNRFDSSIDVVDFVLRCKPSAEPCIDPGVIKVNKIKVRGSKKIIVNIDVSDKVSLPDDYDVHDIEVRSTTGGRGGKGTTFKVQSKDTNPSECNFNFEATFDDFDTDGVKSDGYPFDKPIYAAIGGKGFRLDTNGSGKLGRRNDTRFIRIDFSDAMPDGLSCLEPNDLDAEYNVGGAAGFCDKLQGVDLRLEHQIQDLETTGLCTTQEGTPESLAVRLSFEGEVGGLLRNPSKNGRDDGGAVALSLNYGCLAPNLEQSVMRGDYRAKVTRVDSWTWRIEGEYACLHTYRGYMLREEPCEYGSPGEPIYLYMPFGLTIVDVEAP